VGQSAAPSLRMPCIISGSLFPLSLRFIVPCSPVTAKSVLVGDDWLHEPKLDGYRLPDELDGRHLALVKTVFPRRIGLWVTRAASLRPRTQHRTSAPGMKI